MDYSIWAFLMLAIGLVLLVAEVFIPSGGIIFILAAGSLVTSLLCAWLAWWPGQPTYFWGFIAGMVLLLPVSVGLAFHLWPSTPIGRRAILEGPAPHEVDGFGEQERKNQQLVGKVGETVTTLNPSGMALIDGARVHCQSEWMIVEAGTRVRVVGSRMNTVIVRRMSTSENADNAGDVAPSGKASDKPADTAGESAIDPFDLDLT